MKYIKTYEAKITRKPKPEGFSKSQSDLQKEIHRRTTTLLEALTKYMKVFYSGGQIPPGKKHYVLGDFRTNSLNVSSRDKILRIVSYGLREAMVLLLDHLKKNGLVEYDVDLNDTSIYRPYAPWQSPREADSKIWFYMYHNSNLNMTFQVWIRPEILTDVIDAIEELILTDEVQLHGSMTKYNL